MKRQFGPRINVISARLGGFAEVVMREIAHPTNKNSDPLKNRREFGVWQENICTGIVRKDTGEIIQLSLKLGNVEEGLFLMDSTVFSLSPISISDTRVVIPVAEKIQLQRGTKTRNPLSIANNIIGALIAHGPKGDVPSHVHYLVTSCVEEVFPPGVANLTEPKNTSGAYF